MAKQPALSTQLKAANAKIAELEAKLKDMSSRNDSNYSCRQKAEAEIEQAHQILDAVPNSVGRKSENEDAWARIERTLTTRLAAWLAIRP